VATHETRAFVPCFAFCRPRPPGSRPLRAFGSNEDRRAAGLVPAGINPAARSFLPNALNSAQVKEKYKNLYGDEADQRLQEAREAVWKGEVFADVGEANWKQLGFTSFETEGMWLNALCQMGLTVCNCHPKSCLITSDNPVILTCQSQKDSPGLGLKDAEVWFPISYNKGLLWTWRDRGISKMTLGHSATRVQNRNMIRWCYREVYAPLPEDWLGPAVTENSFDPRYGHYGSLEQVAGNHALYAADASGAQKEIVDMLAALRAGEKCDALRLEPSFQPRGTRPTTVTVHTVGSRDGACCWL
jgi:hypothetical protein